MIVNKNKIINNVKSIKEKTNKEVMAVLKSDAYNVGSRQMIEILEKSRIDFYVFNHLSEYLKCVDLLHYKKVLLLESINLAHLDNISSNVRLSVNSLVDAIDISKGKNSRIVHIQVDTGMNRDGIRDIEEFREVVKALKGKVYIEGIYTHFTEGNSLGRRVLQQIKLLAFLAVFNPPVIHTAASSALNFPILGTHVRVGIALYGFDQELAVNLYTRIYKINSLQPNEPLGYKGIYKAKKAEYIGVIPLGYYEGFHNEYIYQGDKCFKIVGKTCMNHSFVLLGKRIKNSSLLNIFPINDKINEEKKTFCEQLASLNHFSRIYLTEYTNDIRTVFKKTNPKSVIPWKRSRSS